METYTVEKHWFTFVPPLFWSVILSFTVIMPFIIMFWALLRYKLDKIEVKDGLLCSRIGVIAIDKKTIPLDQISFITVRNDIISEWMGFGCIEVQSSAFAKAISYLYIKNPQGLVDFVNKNK